MALIKCKECGHEISDKASVCPNCGAPLVIDETIEEEVLSEVPQKEKWWKKYFTRKILLLICILIAMVGFVCSIGIHPPYAPEETWWGDNSYNYIYKPFLFVVLGGLIVALIISIACYLLSKKHIGWMLVGVVLVGIVSGATIWVGLSVYDSQSHKASNKTECRYSDINNVRENIGGTIWRNNIWRESSSPQNESKVEIIFSPDGSSAKIVIDGNESDYEKPTDISNKDFIDNKGNSIHYILVSFSKGILAIPCDFYGGGATFNPIIRKPKVSYYGNPYASLSSITVGVQEGAYSAAREALKYNITYVEEYGNSIEMTEIRKDKNGNECIVIPQGMLREIRHSHSDNSTIDEKENKQENQQDSAIPAGLTFRTFTKNYKESGNTIQLRLANEAIVSNLKKLGFDLIDRTTESRPDYTGEDYYEVTVETFSKAVNGNVTTVKLESEYTEIHFPNLNDVEEFKKTVRDCGLKETEDGFMDSEDIYWAGTDVSIKGTIVNLCYKFEP